MSEQPLSRRGFKFAALISLIIGLLFLAIPSLYFLLKLMIDTISKPFIYINNVIGSTILNIIGNNLLLFGAFLFITTAILFGVGYLIKDDNDRVFYEFYIYLAWLITGLLIIILTAASAPESIIAGSGCLTYISPLFILLVHKGLTFIYKKYNDQ